jgi:hypothetical protein
MTTDPELAPMWADRGSAFIDHIKDHDRWRPVVIEEGGRQAALRSWPTQGQALDALDRWCRGRGLLLLTGMFALREVRGGD